MGEGPRDAAGFDSVPDEELMLMTGRGDTDAFEALVRRHERRVVGYFLRLHWDRYRAEDQAQEVFIRLFTHARDYVPTARFTTYMYRIAHNYWVDDIRRAKKERGQISLDAHDEEGTSLRDLVVAGTEDPRDKARKEEVLDAVIAAVDTLPDEQKAVFVLSEVKEMRYADIAEMLGIPVGTVKSRMHGAVRRLRTRLADIAPRGARE
jgi:RNA polymerase sigma-70 factor (ECF subfamily)